MLSVVLRFVISIRLNLEIVLFPCAAVDWSCSDLRQIPGLDDSHFQALHLRSTSWKQSLNNECSVYLVCSRETQSLFQQCKAYIQLHRIVNLLSSSQRHQVWNEIMPCTRNLRCRYSLQTIRVYWVICSVLLSSCPLYVQSMFVMKLLLHDSFGFRLRVYFESDCEMITRHNI